MLPIFHNLLTFKKLNSTYFLFLLKKTLLIRYENMKLDQDLI